MKKQLIFPLLLIALDLAAAVVYCCQGDLKKATYWVAAVLNITVTF